MERSVPWWRRALDFALNGMRSGWGLFRRNGKSEAGAETVREAGITDGRIDEPKEEIAVKHSSPHSEEVAAEVERTAEVGPTEEARPDAQAIPTGSTAVGVEVQAEPVEREVRPAEIQAEADEQTAEVSDAEESNPAAETKAAVPAEERVEPVEAHVPVSSAEPVETLGAAPEEAAQVDAAEESAAVQATESAPAAATGQAAPAAEVAEDESAAKEQTVDVAAVEEPAANETAPKLPFAPEPAKKRTTAEKVAAALKARGEDAEQSPFSVIVSQVYDGPLDLLLDLIRKQDIDIYDIPIAKITAQFLAYVDRLKEGDMDVAGEFIYTAALLIHIKSKMLLPRAPAGPEDAAEDPRRELVERLLEHERFKNAAQMLHEKQMLEAATWTNPGVREFREEENAEAGIGPEIAADTTDLVRVFSNILERARNRPVINVQEDTVTVGQMIQFLARRLTMEDKPVALRRLLSHTRSERALIAMFLALLEMVRLQAILLRQDRQFSEIFIKKHTGFEAAMNHGLANARDDWR